MDFSEAYNDTCSQIGLWARYGKYHMVKKCILQGQPCDVADNRGFFPVHEAASSGKLRCLHLLIKKNKGHINLQSYAGHTPLHLAIIQGHLKCVKLLLKCGANTIIGDYDFNLPLLLAISHNDDDIIANFFIQQGIYDSQVLTCSFLLAIEHDRFEMMKTLINLGADISGIDHIGRNAAYIAAENGRSDILTYLIPLINDDKENFLNCQTLDGVTPLFAAAQECNPICMEMLLKFGADPNIECHNGSLPFHIACERGYTNIISRLLPPITDIKALWLSGINLFEFIIYHEKYNSLNTLLKHKILRKFLLNKNWLIPAHKYTGDLDEFMALFTGKTTTNCFTPDTFTSYLLYWNIFETLLPYSAIFGEKTLHLESHYKLINNYEALLLTRGREDQNNNNIEHNVAKVTNFDPVKFDQKNRRQIDPLYILYALNNCTCLNNLLDFVHINFLHPDGDLFASDPELASKYGSISINSFIRDKIWPPIGVSSLSHLNLNLDYPAPELISFYFNSLEYSTVSLPSYKANLLEEKSRLPFEKYAGPRALKHLCRMKIRQIVKTQRPSFEPLCRLLFRIPLPKQAKNYILFRPRKICSFTTPLNKAQNIH